MNPLLKKQINILIVDDEKSIIDFVKMGLEAEGYTVYSAFDGMEAIEIAEKIKPQIIILDIMLPGMDGYEVCSIIKKFIKTSIIMLTARDDVDDKVRGLDIGADDYMAKPFSFKELLARINARIRSDFPKLDDMIRIGDFTLDDGAHEFIYCGEVLDLSPTQYNLLKFLLMNNGIVLSKSLILEKVWGYDFNGEENIVEVYVRYLRDKLQDKEHNLIKTVRGVGYKMVAQ
ncbi:transcriptional regulatory protein YycF [Clostridium saccharobutylicum]|uniref:response regulator transcription factor n=1 Tax=Clostridium saccharobutylicum TaxID=169679 RepID=UPI000983D39B|nr:response regulator transcription factor [Clostridium saccharobutylicum]AQS08639.1 transcriptional regulatory protein YycF [Clostridium saccharobutylicum]MBC2436109.1 response regulator transcription factor [Clostridium saccharobutylicum]NSB87887.1 two-component system OmpR family response regulator [Clostridium saccharobutylicum]NYC29017.1 two-component system OmpR family response regulator [Clostridium saccharobutylicum]OOM13341.1 transcriptional regulatory protein YycF [Clostridium saccha